MADRFDSAWEERYSSGLALNAYPFDVIVSLTAKYFGGKGRGRVLDLGCGAGNHALFLARLGFDVTGVDISASALTVARERATREELSVEFKECGFGQLATLEGPFDLIVDRGALTCMDYDTLVASTMPAVRSLLAPGGLIFSTFLSTADPLARDRGAGYTVVLTERSGAADVRLTFVDQAGVSELFSSFAVEQLHHQVREPLIVADGAPSLGASAEFIVVARRPR